MLQRYLVKKVEKRQHFVGFFFFLLTSVQRLELQRENCDPVTPGWGAKVNIASGQSQAAGSKVKRGRDQTDREQNGAVSEFVVITLKNQQQGNVKR